MRIKGALTLGLVFVSWGSVESANAVSSVGAAATSSASRVSGAVVPGKLTLRAGAPAVVAALVITNRLRKSLRLSEVTVQGPKDLELHMVEPEATIRPHARGTVALDIDARDSATPQDSAAILRLTLIGGGRRPLKIAIAEPVRIEPAAQEALLIVLGIPGLVLVPGFLMIATGSALWRLRVRRQWWDQAEFPVATPSPEFWAGAVTVSIGVAVVAHAVGLDLINSYSPTVLLWIWLLSLLAGAAIYLVWVKVRNVQYAARSPRGSDGPEQTLRKLHRRGLTARRERYRVGAGGDAPVLYLLQRAEEAGDRVWLAPGIRFEWVAAECEPLKKELRQSLEETHDARKLARLLESGRQSGELEVHWATETAGAFQGPSLVDRDQLEAQKAGVIVQRS